MPTGTPVYAPSAGVVTLAEPDLFYSGGTIILDHGHGLSSSFLHLSEVLVEPGQAVRQGLVLPQQLQLGSGVLGVTTRAVSA